MATLPGNSLTASLDSVAAKAVSALEGENAASLQAFDKIFFHQLYQRAREGRAEALDEFVDTLFLVLESSGARRFEEPGKIPALLVRWRSFADLAAAARRDVPTLDRARQLVDGYKHGWRMLRILSKAGRAGLPQKELAKKLKISPQNLSKSFATTLRDLERWNAIERRRAGQRAFVSLGPVGLLLLRAGNIREISEAERKDLFGGRQPISNGRKLLAVSSAA